ncbi:MAG: hypothetical protein LBD46_04600 [Endomicrobium sp.]|jgi:hypothetical protein|nr:hypothetical protein [Endomicrobium sp.]
MFSKTLKKIRLSKITAVLTAASFMLSVFTTGGWSATAQMSMLQPAGIAPALSFSENIVPFNIGRVTDVLNTGNGKVIVNIQDLHAHEETQRNINGILSILDAKYGINKIYVEGAAGQVSTGWLANIEDESFKDAAINALIREGELSGAEYYSIKSSKINILQGIENAELYIENFKRLEQIYKKRDEIRSLIPEINDFLNVVSQAYYSRENRKFIITVNKYKEGKMKADRYFRYLLEKAGKNEVNLANYPSVVSFEKIIKLQASMRNKKLTAQITELIGLLKEKLPYSEYKKISDLFGKKEEEGNLSLALGDIYYKYGFVGKYNELEKFFELTSLNQNINPIYLVQEEKKLTKEIMYRFAMTNSEREVLFLNDMFSTFENYLNNKVSAREYEYFEKNLLKFKILWKKYVDIAGLPEIDRYYELFDRFYKVNVERNRYFLEQITGKLPKQTQEKIRTIKNPEQKSASKLLENAKNIDVVITGGFHTHDLAKLMGDNGYSYIVITPNVTQDTIVSNKNYEINILKQSAVLQNTFKDLIQSNTLNLAADNSNVIDVIASYVTSFLILQTADIEGKMQEFPQIFAQMVKDNAKQLHDKFKVDNLSIGVPVKEGEGYKITFTYTDVEGKEQIAVHKVLPRPPAMDYNSEQQKIISAGLFIAGIGIGLVSAFFLAPISVPTFLAAEIFAVVGTYFGAVGFIKTLMAKKAINEFILYVFRIVHKVPDNHSFNLKIAEYHVGEYITRSLINSDINMVLPDNTSQRDFLIDFKEKMYILGLSKKIDIVNRFAKNVPSEIKEVSLSNIASVDPANPNVIYVNPIALYFLDKNAPLIAQSIILDHEQSHIRGKGEIFAYFTENFRVAARAFASLLKTEKNEKIKIRRLFSDIHAFDIMHYEGILTEIEEQKKGKVERIRADRHQQILDFLTKAKELFTLHSLHPSLFAEQNNIEDIKKIESMIQKLNAERDIILQNPYESNNAEILKILKRFEQEQKWELSQKYSLFNKLYGYMSNDFEFFGEILKIRYKVSEADVDELIRLDKEITLLEAGIRTEEVIGKKEERIKKIQEIKNNIIFFDLGIEIDRFTSNPINDNNKKSFLNVVKLYKNLARSIMNRKKAEVPLLTTAMYRLANIRRSIEENGLPYDEELKKIIDQLDADIKNFNSRPSYLTADSTKEAYIQKLSRVFGRSWAEKIANSKIGYRILTAAIAPFMERGQLMRIFDAFRASKQEGLTEEEIVKRNEKAAAALEDFLKGHENYAEGVKEKYKEGAMGIINASLSAYNAALKITGIRAIAGLTANIANILSHMVWNIKAKKHIMTADIPPVDPKTKYFVDKFYDTKIERDDTFLGSLYEHFAELDKTLKKLRQAIENFDDTEASEDALKNAIAGMKIDPLVDYRDRVTYLLKYVKKRSLDEAFKKLGWKGVDIDIIDFTNISVDGDVSIENLIFSGDVIILNDSAEKVTLNADSPIFKGLERGEDSKRIVKDVIVIVDKTGEMIIEVNNLWKTSDQLIQEISQKSSEFNKLYTETILDVEMILDFYDEKGTLVISNKFYTEQVEGIRKGLHRLQWLDKEINEKGQKLGSKETTEMRQKRDFISRLVKKAETIFGSITGELKLPMQDFFNKVIADMYSDSARKLMSEDERLKIIYIIIGIHDTMMDKNMIDTKSELKKMLNMTINLEALNSYTIDKIKYMYGGKYVKSKWIPSEKGLTVNVDADAYYIYGHLWGSLSTAKLTNLDVKGKFKLNNLRLEGKVTFYNEGEEVVTISPETLSSFKLNKDKEGRVILKDTTVTVDKKEEISISSTLPQKRMMIFFDKLKIALKKLLLGKSYVDINVPELKNKSYTFIVAEGDDIYTIIKQAEVLIEKGIDVNIVKPGNIFKYNVEDPLVDNIYKYNIDFDIIYLDKEEIIDSLWFMKKKDDNTGKEINIYIYNVIENMDIHYMKEVLEWFKQKKTMLGKDNFGIVDVPSGEGMSYDMIQMMFPEAVIVSSLSNKDKPVEEIDSRNTRGFVSSYIAGQEEEILTLAGEMMRKRVKDLYMESSPIFSTIVDTSKTSLSDINSEAAIKELKSFNIDTIVIKLDTSNTVDVKTLREILLKAHNQGLKVVIEYSLDNYTAFESWLESLYSQLVSFRVVTGVTQGSKDFIDGIRLDLSRMSNDDAEKASKKFNVVRGIINGESSEGIFGVKSSYYAEDIYRDAKIMTVRTISHNNKDALNMVTNAWVEFSLGNESYDLQSMDYNFTANDIEDITKAKTVGIVGIAYDIIKALKQTEETPFDTLNMLKVLFLKRAVIFRNTPQGAFSSARALAVRHNVLVEDDSEVQLYKSLANLRAGKDINETIYEIESLLKSNYMYDLIAQFKNINTEIITEIKKYDASKNTDYGHNFRYFENNNKTRSLIIKRIEGYLQGAIENTELANYEKQSHKKLNYVNKTNKDKLGKMLLEAKLLMLKKDIFMNMKIEDASVDVPYGKDLKPIKDKESLSILNNEDNAELQKVLELLDTLNTVNAVEAFAVIQEAINILNSLIESDALSAEAKPIALSELLSLLVLKADFMQGNIVDTAKEGMGNIIANTRAVLAAA